jgi:uncharacterized protein (DUF1778 family)
MYNNKLEITFKLNTEQWEQFLQLLESPQPVNKRLVKLLTEPRGSTGEFIVISPLFSME